MNRPSLACGLASLLILAGCGGSEPDAVFDSRATISEAAPASDSGPGASRTIPDRYIVVFRNSVRDPGALADALVRGHGGQLGFTYKRVLKGFSAALPAAAVAALERHPDVAFVEPDQTVSLTQTIEQAGATWGLDRIDQRDLPLSTTYGYVSSGFGVRAYIIDTGILAGHPDFGGRVVAGATAIDDRHGTNDCNGHGTHVAGTVGSTTWGVAKGVTLVPVRVLNCRGSGTWSGVIAGIDWTVTDAAEAGLPAVANLSLGGGASASVDLAVANATQAGVAMVVAAGNDGANACNYSPAREPSALTVGATDSSDGRPFWSNIGSCLDLFAPGASITSTSNSGSTAVKSGTSMAAPHVAGVAALFLSSAGNAAATPAAVGESIVQAATPDKVLGAGTDSPNKLLYSGSQRTSDSGDSEPPTSPSPEATISVASIDGEAFGIKNSWRARVTIGIIDGASVAVDGASVSGSFTAGGSGTCVTAGGVCTIESGNINNRTASTTFVVTGVVKEGSSYSPGENQSIHIAKP